MKKYKIIVADDHPFLLEGIMRELERMPQLEIVGAVQNGIELMSLVSQQRPDIVLLDLNMPGYDGIECLQKIKADHPSIRVVVLTSYTQPELIDEIKRKHADGFLSKESPGNRLCEAIDQVLHGLKYFPVHEEHPSPGSRFFADGFEKKYALTKRELEIIRLVCKEMNTKEIADKLFLSDLTVNTHRRNIQRKLGVKNVAGLINFAREHDLI